MRILILLLLVVLAVAPARAADEPRPDRVRTELAAPKNPAHQTIHDRLQRMQMLERLARFLSPFRLPREVRLKVEGCDGDVNAYYEDDVVKVCYEYLQFILDNAPQGRNEDGVRRRDAVIGPTIDVFLHEMAHALIDLLKIPVLGREEDAADLISAYIQLKAGGADARALILGTVHLGRVEARGVLGKPVEVKHYADEHGLAGQRYFNVLCVAYGSDPVMFADAVTVWGLPASRAESCEGEYRQLDHAFRTLIEPHIDQVLLAQVRERRWLSVGGPAGGGGPQGRPKR